MEPGNKVILQVQIAVYGDDGIKRVAAHSHPKVEGVRWLVSWQSTDPTTSLPSELAERDDMDVIVNYDKGLAKNRNHALDFKCDAPLVLLSDDDVDYTEEGLRIVIDSFDKYPEADILCFRYTCKGQFVKNYGTTVFDLRHPPFGWYPSTIEIAFRRKIIQGIKFNEKVGLGSGFLVIGEDSVFFHDLIKKGAGGYGIPLTICIHNQHSTGERCAEEPDFLFAHGAIMTYLKPLTWFPRLLLHAHRSKQPYFKYLKYTLRGACHAYSKHLFK